MRREIPTQDGIMTEPALMPGRGIFNSREVKRNPHSA